MYVQYGRVRIYSILTTTSTTVYQYYCTCMITRNVGYHRKGIQVPVLSLDTTCHVLVHTCTCIVQYTVVDDQLRVYSSTTATSTGTVVKVHVVSIRRPVL